MCGRGVCVGGGGRTVYYVRTQAVVVVVVYQVDDECVFITAGPIIKPCAGGEGDSEGHVL